MTSRLTAAQIISAGQYLDPTFNPASLTVSQLLGVLGYHDIPYPMPYTKPKLVETFRQEITNNASRFKKLRAEKENSIASDEGITDGHTGKPLSKSKAKAPSVPAPSTSRRSSRRLSHAPGDEDSSPPPPVAEPPKRRRSSAQPTLGGTRKVSKPRAVTPLAEESEPEEEDLPVTKVSRTRKSGTAGTRSRRISHISGGEESGWDDNNIFQSGAESSSPIRPSPVRPRQSRVSGLPRKSRKSMSAPPEMAESPVRSSFPRSRAFSPPESPFQPQLPPLPKFRLPSPVRKPSPKRESPPPPPPREPTPPQLEEEEHWAEDEDETHDAIKQEEAEEEVESDMALAELPVQPSERTGFSFGAFLGRASAWILILTTLYAVYEYKAESASIGYCQAGTKTNPVLESILKQRQVERDCATQREDIKRQQAALNVSDPVEFPQCPLPPLIPFPRPNSCTPCPAHAACGQFTVTCETGYLLKPHALLPFPVDPSQTQLVNQKVPQVASAIFSAVSALTDGLPGLGSVGLPPRCVEDPMRKQHIGKLGKSIEMMLAKERGRRICQGGLSDASSARDEGADAVQWGIEINKLREHFKQKTQNGRYRDKFDELFDEAIQQLIQWGGVFIGESESGERYVAHKTPDLNWACVVTVKLRQLWAAWRSTVIASILTFLIALALRVRMTQRQKESRRVSGLVQVALDALRNQELAHYTDPTTTPQPYLSSIQLRDLVLQDEHSVPVRRRLWEKVEHIVESNANVRANLEELEGGDETRVWRWVGSAPGGRTPKRKELE